ncbi:hypothetical protein HCN44_006672 [Aphidius gifuensis]|uniref:Uncharacterized protein n=1 Tax=Aphidius gifuensis TaxID=684658 RepID=A0A834XXY0_APHGI|nr:hypothetical protein HCN44_006672 [Aphidius gifuensis]
MAIILPLVFSQIVKSPTDESTTDGTTAAIKKDEGESKNESTTEKPTEQVKNQQPKDEKTLISQFNKEDKLIDNSKLNAPSMLAKLILTPFVYFIRGLLFIFKYADHGLLFMMRLFMDVVLASTGLGAVEGLVNPTLKGITPIADMLIDSISCLLHEMAYGAPLMRCPIKYLQ